MVNVWLVIVAVVVTLLLAAANCYFIVYFQHAAEKRSEWWAKAIVVLGMLLAELCVLMLPLDVANRGPPDGGFPMGTLWLVVYCLIAAFVVLVLPFSMFWYDEEDAENPSKSKRLRRALFSTTIVLLVFAGLYVLAYIFLGVAEIGVQKLSAPLMRAGDPMPAVGCLEPCLSVASQLALRVSPVLFLVTEIDFFGYFLLVFLGGIGLAALPFDLLLGWHHRPHAIPRDQFLKERADIGRRADALLEIGRLVLERRRSGARGRKERDRYNRWRQAVELLDGDWQHLKASYEISGGTVILAWAKLALGLLSTVLSLAWILHIVLYLIVPGKKIPFLNGFLIALNSAWGFLGTIAYALFAFYLLLCVIKGVTKFGMRFFFFFPVFPMKVGETMQHAFMFNVLLMLVSSLTVTHFCSDAFEGFATATESSQVFVLSIGSLRIVRYFFRYAVFALLGVPLLSLIYLSIRPHDKDASERIQDD